MWCDDSRTGSTLTLRGASQWRLQISACSAIGCLSVTSAMEISTLLTQLPVSSLEPYSILAVTGQQIECEKARRVPTAKQQILELRSATSIQRANFTVNHGSHIRQGV